MFPWDFENDTQEWMEPDMTPQQQAAIARCCDHENLVGELVEALEECLEDSEQAVADYILKYGENWRPQRLAAMRETVLKARAVLAKAKEGAQS